MFIRFMFYTNILFVIYKGIRQIYKFLLKSVLSHNVVPENTYIGVRYTKNNMSLANII